MNREIDLSTYFQRIGFSGDAKPNIKTLFEIHQKHVRAIPFENINPFLGLPVNIDASSLQDKLVKNKRGGYCYEQNGLLQKVLEEIGFSVLPLAARVLWSAKENEVTTLSHMLLMVTAENQEYLVDVGFGGQVLPEPILLRTTDEQQTSHEIYKVEQEDGDFFLRTKIKNRWKTMYRFNLNRAYPVDYQMMNWYSATSPDSFFINALSVAMVFDGGRLTLFNNRFTTYRINEGAQTQYLKDVPSIIYVLEKVFRLNLSTSKGLEQILDKMIFNPQKVEVEK